MAKTTAYFKKSLIFNPVHLKDGKQIPWVRVGRHDGVVETDDKDIIEPLDRLAKANRLGVARITKEEFEAQKKIGASSLQTWSPRLDARGQELTLNPAAKPKVEEAKPTPPKELVAAGDGSVADTTKADAPTIQTSVFPDDLPE